MFERVEDGVIVVADPKEDLGREVAAEQCRSGQDRPRHRRHTCKAGAQHVADTGGHQRQRKRARAVRLAQYAVLGVGAVRVLRALGVSPSVFHLNEGHPALGAFELLREEQARGASWDEAWATVVEQIVFTTHTPVPAGNETYGRDEVLHMLGSLAA